MKQPDAGAGSESVKPKAKRVAMPKRSVSPASGVQAKRGRATSKATGIANAKATKATAKATVAPVTDRPPGILVAAGPSVAGPENPTHSESEVSKDSSSGGETGAAATKKARKPRQKKMQLCTMEGIDALFHTSRPHAMVALPSGDSHGAQGHEVDPTQLMSSQCSRPVQGSNTLYCVVCPPSVGRSSNRRQPQDDKSAMSRVILLGLLRSAKRILHYEVRQAESLRWRSATRDLQRR